MKRGGVAGNRTVADEAVSAQAPAHASQQSAPAISPQHKKPLAAEKEENEQGQMSFSGSLIILMVVCAALALLILAQYMW